jgi:glucokinase
MRERRIRLGIDLGGSKILAVVIDSKGRVLGESKHATRAEDGYKKVLKRLARAGNDAMARADLGKEERKGLTVLGLGVPGPVDPEAGEVLVAHNLGWKRRAVARDLGALLHRDVVLGNDVNFGALGEAAYGAAAGCRSVCAAFMGTGLGGAVVVDGRIRNGAHGLTGEVGHLRAPFAQARCSCGNRGCLETTASKTGIARMLREAIAAGRRCRIANPKRLKSSELRRAWKDGCKATRAAVREAARGLGWGLAAFGTAVDPEMYVVGGGVIGALGKQMIGDVKEGLAASCPFFRRNPPPVRLAELGDRAVAIGAAVASTAKGGGR